MQEKYEKGGFLYPSLHNYSPIRIHVISREAEIYYFVYITPGFPPARE